MSISHHLMRVDNQQDGGLTQFAAVGGWGKH